jgi:uncharacterized membrane-anchored protein
MNQRLSNFKRHFDSNAPVYGLVVLFIFAIVLVTLT